MTPATLLDPLASARAEFAVEPGYLAACTVGPPPASTRRAVIADVESAAAGRMNIPEYCAVVERSRDLYARLVSVHPGRVAIGSQASVFAGLVAASLPDGAEVLCVDGDFSSIMLPFVHAGRGIRVRSVPLAQLAEAITEGTDLVAFSLVQSATGEVADAAAIVAGAARHGARTFCDTTQAVGWLAVSASAFDATVCHAYKWLCAPRGVAFLTVAEGWELRPIHAGWYAGDDPWAACYGGGATLAEDARRYDVSPAWQAFVGAEPALELFTALDPAAVYEHTTRLAGQFRAELGIPEPTRPSAIVTWDDPDGADLGRLTAAGIVASGRAGRARVAFHVFNDERDVELAVAALRR
ncbi:aminotransferase class V-fold PLP-dependent enzyme [Microbacterium sp. DT81.1]|uniref:aminotransferase class V-fold PLP-dependent enzyme n=1 Tax=Microbacterium sp. DT81.1 TaxID=3393413 RepID=UPI003CEE5B7B